MSMKIVFAAAAGAAVLPLLGGQRDAADLIRRYLDRSGRHSHVIHNASQIRAGGPGYAPVELAGRRSVDQHLKRIVVDCRDRRPGDIDRRDGRPRRHQLRHFRVARSRPPARRSLVYWVERNA